MMTQVTTQLNSTPDQPCCRRLDDALDSAFFRALAEPGRLDLLVRLAGCSEPATVTEIAACCPTDLSVVSRHLAAMRDARILTSERRGRQVLYTVDFRAVSYRLRAIADAIDACCPAASVAAEADSGDPTSTSCCKR